MKVNNFKVLGYMLVGLFLAYFPITLVIYTGTMVILVAYYGKDEKEAISIKLYLVIFYTFLFFNYSYWYEYAIYLNDIHAIIIEFCIFTFVPTGIFLLPNHKGFVSYTPSDPDLRSISLSGFDEDEM